MLDESATRHYSQAEVSPCFLLHAFYNVDNIMKKQKKAETIQSDLQGLANNDPLKSQSMKILEDT